MDGGRRARGRRGGQHLGRHGQRVVVGTYDGGDSVVELSPALGLEQHFSPSNWQDDNENDRDLGSAPPALLSNGTLLQAGKSHTAFLLNQASLGGIGNQINSAAAVPRATMPTAGTPCWDRRVHALRQRGAGDADQPARSRSGWTAAGGAPGPPIIAGGLVWSIGGGSLYGHRPRDTGQR